jgi:trimeric autotransporter adhesin
MKRTVILSYFLFIVCHSSFSQNVGIGTNTPDVSAGVDISSANKGLLIPRMTTSNIGLISAPAKGLMVYDTVLNQLMINMGTAASPAWQTVVYKSGWGLGGNSGINPSAQFIGTTDNQPLRFRINNTNAGELNPVTGNIFWGKGAGQNNTNGYSNIGIGADALKSNTSNTNLVAIGDSALFTNTSGWYNTAVGSHSLFTNSSGYLNTATGAESLYSNTTGLGNVANGASALSSNTMGNYNVAMGGSALGINTTGSNNSAIGTFALYLNTTGSQNVANGFQSLNFNSTASYNSANGVRTLFSNTTGEYNVANGYYSLYTNNASYNTANGAYSLYSNSSGWNNTATGYEAMRNNSTGHLNTSMGSEAMRSNTTGNENNAVGYYALYNNTSGSYNTAVGTAALFVNATAASNTAVGDYALYINNESFNTALGYSALYNTTVSQYNTAIGYAAGYSYNNGYNNVFVGANTDVNNGGYYNVIAIGQSTVVGGVNTARFGNAATSSYGGWAGWTNVSDGRYKKNIQENVPGLAFITKLRPVTYHLAAASLDEFLHKNNKIEMSDAGKKMYAKALMEKEKITYTGFVAQEVEAAAKKLGFDFSGVDAPKNENDTYGLRYAEFVVPLVKGMQEQQQQIEELKKEIDLLKEQNKTLMQLLNKKN